MQVRNFLKRPSPTNGSVVTAVRANTLRLLKFTLICVELNDIVTNIGSEVDSW